MPGDRFGKWSIWLLAPRACARGISSRQFGDLIPRLLHKILIARHPIGTQVPAIFQPIDIAGSPIFQMSGYARSFIAPENSAGNSRPGKNSDRPNRSSGAASLTTNWSVSMSESNHVRALT